MPRTKRNDDGYTLLREAGNGDHKEARPPYGRIVEISAYDIPSHNASDWYSLSCELVLRLEQTPLSKALAIPFRDEETLKRAIKAISDHFRRHHGAGIVRLNSHVFKEDGTAWLYVRRGERWAQRRCPDERPLPTDDVIPSDVPVQEKEETHEQENTHKRGRGRPRRHTQSG